VPRPITPALDTYFKRDFTPPSQTIWMTVALPFFVFGLIENMLQPPRRTVSEDRIEFFAPIVCVVTLLTLPVLAGANVLPRVATFVIEGAYLAITLAIGVWLAGKEERSQAATLEARQRVYKQGRAVDVEIDSVHELDIGGVRVRGKVRQRGFAIDLPPALASRVAEGGLIEVLEPVQPDDEVLATALLE
jgi:hypothetical protein